MTRLVGVSIFCPSKLFDQIWCNTSHDQFIETCVLTFELIGIFGLLSLSMSLVNKENVSIENSLIGLIDVSNFVFLKLFDELLVYCCSSYLQLTIFKYLTLPFDLALATVFR